ncbi:hypothetical protein OIDMADRAFT_25794 [Oidiodendron maius Zn]|uniref:Uncharacterized protein n=1 Tax=Oidiodendron maius (strain Zn) TaxID=913774 RepID=A0A0C3DT12_OIDMZ|nr:hypothetical protein OIDMADRAFT_25794 [Oidiodendron maius Zn]
MHPNEINLRHIWCRKFKDDDGNCDEDNDDDNNNNNDNDEDDGNIDCDGDRFLLMFRIASLCVSTKMHNTPAFLCSILRFGSRTRTPLLRLVRIASLTQTLVKQQTDKQCAYGHCKMNQEGGPLRKSNRVAEFAPD